NTTLSIDSTVCEELTLKTIPNENLENYYENNFSYLYQYSLTPDENDSWMNISDELTENPEITFGISDLKEVNLEEDDRIYFRAIAGSYSILSNPPAENFNKHDANRNYSVSETISATKDCSPITNTRDVKK